MYQTALRAQGVHSSRGLSSVMQGTWATCITYKWICIHRIALTSSYPFHLCIQEEVWTELNTLHTSNSGRPHGLKFQGRTVRCQNSAPPPLGFRSTSQLQRPQGPVQPNWWHSPKPTSASKLYTLSANLYSSSYFIPIVLIFEAASCTVSSLACVYDFLCYDLFVLLQVSLSTLGFKYLNIAIACIQALSVESGTLKTGLLLGESTIVLWYMVSLRPPTFPNTWSLSKKKKTHCGAVNACLYLRVKFV